MWSKQELYCNVCGHKMLVEIPNQMGRNCKVCSSKCLDEFQWRETLSIMGKPYHPRGLQAEEGQ
ncbi:hypothetical protein A2Z67_05115 [Candidatus Woesebacteria bacterium RBG_13_36_22]|uniref:Uncharacterized protein n=1 Tax=Candidatus Woesebacteria bacterium RBG_13_36_22 TaxID=1802478 RepID=A0A1F7X2I2_9BACT|nr:MAG: hypothetical protein A2Z67_05115 [Candidatus Woesebacteria bacterium RBG_13_36_22]